MNRTVIARAVACVLEEVGDKLTPSLTINFRLDDEHQSVRRWNGWLTTTEKYNGFEKVLEALRAMGFKGFDVESLHGADENVCEKLLPDAVSLVIEDEPSQDGSKLFEKVKWVNKLGSSVLTAKHGLTPANRMTIAEKFKQAALAEKMKAGGTQKPEAPADMSDEFASLGDDEDPFG
jgi:hypothetical protein